MIQLWRSRSVGRFSVIGCSRASPGSISLVWLRGWLARGRPVSGAAAARDAAGPGSVPQEPAPHTSLSSSTGLIAALIHLRHDLPHSVLDLLFGVDRSTVTGAIGEIQVLLAERECVVPDRPGLRLRILADVSAYTQAEGIELRLDATEIQVRRPPAGRGGRRTFVTTRRTHRRKALPDTYRAIAGLVSDRTADA